jgi:hypothetical protein
MMQEVAIPFTSFPHLRSGTIIRRADCFGMGLGDLSDGSNGSDASIWTEVLTT